MNRQARPSPSRFDGAESKRSTREATSAEHAVSQRHRINGRDEGEERAVAYSGQHELKLPLHAPSEPPPCDRTIAYDREELSRLLEATEGIPAIPSSFPTKAPPPTLNTAETIRPPSSMKAYAQKAPDPEATLNPLAHAAPLGNEEPTRAYDRARLSDPLDDAADHPSRRSNPNAPTRPAPGIRNATAELELGRIPPLRNAMSLAMSIEAPRIEELDAPATQPAGFAPKVKPRPTITPILAISGLIGLFAAGTVLPVPSLFALRNKLVSSTTSAFAAVRGETDPQTSSHPAGQLVELNLSILPPQATVYLDGRTISNPLRIAYPADSKKHELRAEAPGHESRRLQLTFERDIQVELSLTQLPASKVSPEAATESSSLP
jgi:hypothetical protein